ncbi:MAG: hypothetical protein PHD63_04370, partial [Candidatus Marinimicrobia bacterium]|nr:hypothetical protein [Candidatus Neomarinimicrobiota bacterium]
MIDETAGATCPGMGLANAETFPIVMVPSDDRLITPINVVQMTTIIRMPIKYLVSVDDMVHSTLRNT